MKRYEKENYTHADWTVERRRGHINALLIEEHADVIDGRDVLQLGCNTGTTLALVTGRARFAEGLDVNAAAVEEARALGCNAAAGNALAMGYGAGFFDTIIAFDFIEHIYPFDMPRLVSECRRVLRPGGRLLAFSPRTDPDSPSEAALDSHHVQWFATAESFFASWRGQFELIATRYETRANPSGGSSHDGIVMLIRRKP